MNLDLRAILEDHARNNPPGPTMADIARANEILKRRDVLWALDVVRHAMAIEERQPPPVPSADPARQLLPARRALMILWEEGRDVDDALAGLDAQIVALRAERS